MITSIKDTNADQYSILFSKAVKDLMSHDDNGNRIDSPTPGAETPAIPYETISLSSYEPSTYYRWDPVEKEFVLATEEEAFDDETYYKIKNDNDYIASLNEYFSYIKTLALINKTYTMLSLDEPTFDIDLNTREIKVPEHFEKNGISVQGDEIAEIIYFKVNRYFDMIDLATQDIYIQWRSAAVDEEGEYIEGVSTPWCVDYESQPGYIIFGWPISSKITAESGQIAFAVRFYTYDADELKTPLTYSLSTLTQIVTVKPALNFDLVGKILRDGAQDGFISDNNINLILNRLVNSENSEGAEPATEPIFIMNLQQGNNTVSEDGRTFAWLGLDSDGFRTVPVKLQVEAISTDAGRISYNVSKYKLDGTFDEDYQGATTIYIKSIDTERVQNKKYYSYVDGLGYPEIEDFSEIEWNADPDERNLYERVFEVTIDTIGMYRVRVTNRVGRSQSSVLSYMVIVEKPKTVTVTNPVISGYVNDTLLSIEANSDDSDKSKFTYQWSKKSLNGNEYAEVSGATENTYLPEETGFYKVNVRNNLHVDYNGELDYTTVDSLPARITERAKTCTVVAMSKTQIPRQQLGEGFRISVTPDSSEIRDVNFGDTILYQWYDYGIMPGAEYDNDVAAANNGLYETTEADSIVEGATEATFLPNSEQTGTFYCKVTNRYNNDEKSINSMFFTITDE